MKQRSQRPPYSPAQLRELNSFFYMRILKAVDFQDWSMVRETAEQGVALNRDHRKAAAAALSRQRQLKHNTPLILLVDKLTPNNEALTVAEVEDACASRGLRYSRTTIRDLLELVGILKPDKPGPKRPR